MHRCRQGLEENLGRPAPPFGVRREAVYQVLAYAHRDATQSAVLIYPHRAAVGRPGLQRGFVILAL